MNNKQRLKNVLNIYSGGTPQENDIYLTENEISISWLTPSDFSTGSDILKSSRFIKNGCQKSILLPKNSLIMSCRAPVGKIGYIKNNGMAFNQGCKGFIPKKNQNSKYWFFVLLSLKNEFDKFSKGTTFKEINTKNVKNIIVRKETIQNQNLIANFLEKISSNINLNIEKKSKKIELLKEYKEALIYETVTKGLDKNVEMKDSGVDWIARIPRAWSIKRVKDCVVLQGGGSDKKINNDEKEVSLINYTDVYKNKKLDKNLNYMKVTYPEDKIKKIQVYKNDLLITPTSETADDIGKVNIVLEEMNDTVFSYHILRMRAFKNSCPFYLKYYFNSIASKLQFNKKATGITRVTLSRNDILSNKIVLPPLNEQNKIVYFLDKKTEEIDNELEKLYKKIELIKELKESIIYECVTGKLDIEKEGEKYQKIIESI